MIELLCDTFTDEVGPRDFSPILGSSTAFGRKVCVAVMKDTHQPRFTYQCLHMEGMASHSNLYIRLSGLKSRIRMHLKTCMQAITIKSLRLCYSVGSSNSKYSLY